jgi:dynein heavy chain
MHRKIKDESIAKIMENDGTKTMLNQFCEPSGHFLFIMQTGSDSLSVSNTPPLPSAIKKKSLIVVKAREELADPEESGDFPTGIANEIVFMEINRPIMENLYLSCHEVFSPLLSNPLNQMGWSDLVCKDLMEKFNNFLAHTNVTIGQIHGKTNLPLPPPDVTSSDKTSSKDKAAILETAIIHWTK